MCRWPCPFHFSCFLLYCCYLNFSIHYEAGQCNEGPEHKWFLTEPKWIWTGTKTTFLIHVQNFLVQHKHFGPSHNSFGPVEWLFMWYLIIAVAYFYDWRFMKSTFHYLYICIDTIIFLCIWCKYLYPWTHLKLKSIYGSRYLDQKSVFNVKL